MIVIIISVLLYLDSIWGQYLKNIIGLTSNKILKQHFNITTNRRLIHIIMSSVPEITVKGCWSPQIKFPCAFPWVRLVKSTGVIYISYKYPATVEFHPLSLFSSCGRSIEIPDKQTFYTGNVNHLLIGFKSLLI